MKEKFILLFFAVITVINANAQLTKNFWLVGGMGTFNTYKKVLSDVPAPNVGYTADYTEIVISPKIGYFIMDKFAIGLVGSYEYGYGKISNGGLNRGQHLAIGPFARYYFLDKDKIYNILTEVNYQYGKVNFYDGVNGSQQKFNVLAGPVIFFNSSVGVEFLMGYKYSKEKIDNNNSLEYIDARNGFQFAIGLQIHLEKR